MKKMTAKKRGHRSRMKKMTAKKRGHRSRKKEPSESIHVKVDNPKYLRKQVLTIAIELIEDLKKYEEYMELRKHKETLLRLLKAEVHEMGQLMKEFKLKDLPLTHEQFNKLKVVKEEKREEEKKKRETKKAKEDIEHEVEDREEVARKIARGRRERVHMKEEAAISHLEEDLAALKDKLARI